MYESNWPEAENTIILFVCSTKFKISIVFVFSWDHRKSQEKQETMLKQNLGGLVKSIMVFSFLANWIPTVFFFVIFRLAQPAFLQEKIQFLCLQYHPTRCPLFLCIMYHRQPSLRAVSG